VFLHLFLNNEQSLVNSTFDKIRRNSQTVSDF